MDSPVQAFEALKTYCYEKNVREDADLTAQFTSLKLDLGKGVDYFLRQFDELDSRLSDAGIVLQERVKKAVLINALPDDLETVRQLLRKSDSNLTGMKKEIQIACEDLARAGKRKALVTVE